MKSLTAKCAIFEKSGEPFRHENVSLSAPQASELLVEIEMCTICGSDVHTIEGHRPLSGPMVLGHEIIGSVVQQSDAGEPVCDASGAPLKVGDRITWSLHACCGRCFWCKHQLSQKCDELFKYGHEPVTAQFPCTGGFATHCQLRAGTAIVRIPDEMDARIACPANCATATVAAALRQAGDCRGRCVLILGAGMLGLTATAWAKDAGAESIVVVDPNTSRAELAPCFGATSVAYDLMSGQAEIKAVSSGRGADVSFDFTGNNEAVLAAIHFLRIGGQAVLVGSVSPTGSISLSPEMIVRRWLRIGGVHNYLTEDLVEAMRFLERTGNEYPFDTLVSAVYELADIDQAVQHAASGTAIRVAVV